MTGPGAACDGGYALADPVGGDDAVKDRYWATGNVPQPHLPRTCARSILEGAKHRAQGNNRHEGDERADNPNHDDIEITFAMRRATDGEQRHDSAIVRQAVKGPEPIAATRCINAGFMPCSAAMRI